MSVRVTVEIVFNDQYTLSDAVKAVEESALEELVGQALGPVMVPNKVRVHVQRAERSFP